MGFLHILWDETLAGPTPDYGLGKLRKYNSFSGRRSSTAPPSPTNRHRRRAAATDDMIPVSRSITILRSNASSINATPDSGSVPSSPASSTASNSPFAPSTPRGNYKKLTKGKSTAEPSPTDYDWILLSSLDR